MITNNDILQLSDAVRALEQELRQSVKDLVQLQQDVLARVFAIQTLLQDRSILSAEDVQTRGDEFLKKFAEDLNLDLANLRKKLEEESTTRGYLSCNGSVQ